MTGPASEARRTNRLRWTAGGWFGAQLGGTAWILVAALLAGARDLATGALLLGAFLAPNALGLLLWSRRGRLSCYVAMQRLLPAIGACGALAVFLLERRGLWESIQTGGTVSSGSTYLVLALVVGGLMALFRVRFGGAERG